MSDIYLRVIPTDPLWQPTVEEAERTAAYVAGLFAGPGDDVESVTPVFYEHVTLIDAGQYMEDVSCPRCRAAIGLDWFWDLLRAQQGGQLTSPTVGDLNVTVPCCGSPLTMPELHFQAPVGFARFEVSAMNWTRHTWELSDEELATAGGILGHPIKQIDTRY
ncbi:hypothetical protein CS0771_45190 [Catellatospora sp. IY07-71]|uniref:hypothetical protein n=1 Tax=Catellatospora sp. IY07-71 TaxID=2728827 RepID=UPI001BB3496E|nr:hypothetical protein [Catellatospora sp. IY07-71]BCJ74975.1 hypothetical protein CS0771_45190 [Catellatospora sp. IY07-71]